MAQLNPRPSIGWSRATVPIVTKRLVIATATVVALSMSACSSDGDSTTTAAPATDPTSTDDGDAAATLTGEQICERLTVDSVAADTGLDVVLATPDDSSTPQCAYEYNNDTGALSNLTVAAMRPEDVGGLTGEKAFDYVVQINESIAGPDAEKQEVSAGDAAIRLSGASLHLGVLRVGDQVLTVIIPVNDAEADGVDRLIATMATTLS